jgi:hypothetical protein
MGASVKSMGRSLSSIPYTQQLKLTAKTEGVSKASEKQPGGFVFLDL